MNEEPTAMMEVAVDIAREAGALLMQRLPLGRFAGDVENKSGRELVSAVDRASEALIINRLRAAYPQHAVLAEEGGASGNVVQQGVRWLVDPLDGTTNFLHGHPVFAVSMAAERAGELVAAVVHLPYLDETFFAALGHGAYLNTRSLPLQISRCQTLADALVATGFAYDRVKHDNMGNFKRIVDKALGVRRCGSAATDLAYVAAGRYDAYWELALRPWDLAAGVLLVTEAGGEVSDFAAQDGFLSSGHVVAANASLRAQVCALLDPPTVSESVIAG